MELQTLRDIQKEMKRFNERLEAAILVAVADENKNQKEFDNPKTTWFGSKPDKPRKGQCFMCREAGALKRAALDLKFELEKITK